MEVPLDKEDYDDFLEAKNVILTLFMIDEVNKRAKLNSKLTLFKITYLSNRKSLKRGIPTTSYHWVSHKNGPWAPKLSMQINGMRNFGLITKELPIRLTSFGTEILNEFQYVIDRNIATKELIIEESRNYAEYEDKDEEFLDMVLI